MRHGIFNNRRLARLRTSVAFALLVVTSMSHGACFAGDGVQRYYGRSVPPRAQEFRWSDGGVPGIFDPAFAAAPPDTDLIRALFEGLTDYDPQTLRPVPAVATRWESSNDGRIWTFFLREDARWSNGEPVTAHDFIKSWQRTVQLGDLAPHTELLNNISGTNASGRVPDTSKAAVEKNAESGVARRQPRETFGAEALSSSVLRVQLERPDPNFPSLVAHPVFRPVKMADDPLKKIEPSTLVSNGAFLLSKAETDQVLLERADNYWGKADVNLDRVTFVDSSNAESALAAYREGEVDAVTNAAFQPLAIKLLAPYQDFRRATYGAVNYYSFNTANAPFDDVRVREALAIAIDRERISRVELGGATEPAMKFLPEQMTESNKPVIGKADLLEKDISRARQLLAEAGFPDGRDFPTVRLLINRNEQQRLVSAAVATMWRDNLNIQTEVVVKSWDDYEAAIRAGDFDVVRRGLVMQTTDELTNIRMIFRERAPAGSTIESLVNDRAKTKPEQNPGAGELVIESEEQALRDLKAMPIYFASSYALVKPYVHGFHSNVLDAPSLKTVRIDQNWVGSDK